MTFENLNLSDMYARVGVNNRILFDVIKPYSEKSLFPANVERRSRFYEQREANYDSPSLYTLGVSRLLEERSIELASRREQILHSLRFGNPQSIGKLRELESKLHDIGYVMLRPKRTPPVLKALISGLLENAFLYGSKDEVRLIIDEGHEGHIITIEDNGKGFNYNGMIGWLRGAGKRKNSKMRTMRLADQLEVFVVSYENPGNVIHIIYSGVDRVNRGPTIDGKYGLLIH
ncbi:hypothetical protein HYU23_01665 [Candidatus Woesearchaeota archaeon]|nr:hypothetical protein [Candidatus Woesearchaeota archaeon]